MTRALRSFLFLVCAAQLGFATAFFLQWPPAIRLWPFEGTTPLTFILIASFFAAAAASTLWVLASKNYGALAGIGLDYVTILAPVSVFSFQLGASSGDNSMTAFAIECLLGAVFGLGLFLWSARIPLDRTVPMPGPVRWSFVLFVLALLLVGVRLIIKAPNVIPWMLTPELSVFAGWLFLGAAVYFMYGLLRPSWLNAAGQLTGFLAYDMVLIWPFVTRLPTVAPEFRTGLILYIIVVVYSGFLATYYLFLHRPTRLWAPNRTLPMS